MTGASGANPGSADVPPSLLREPRSGGVRVGPWWRCQPSPNDACSLIGDSDTGGGKGSSPGTVHPVERVSLSFAGHPPPARDPRSKRFG